MTEVSCHGGLQPQVIVDDNDVAAGRGGRWMARELACVGESSMQVR